MVKQTQAIVAHNPEENAAASDTKLKIVAIFFSFFDAGFLRDAKLE